MEKESTSKRDSSSLPNCVAVVLTMLVIVALSLSAAAFWQIAALKQEMRLQEVVVRQLKTAKNNSTSQEREISKLQTQVQQLTDKVWYM